MAKPAFIYAFDNLGPYRFTELCGELLGQRYNGFLLGGEGADGGIDAEIDKILGILHPQSQTPFLNEIIQPGKTVIFQFKHKVTARVGQSQSREQLLGLYKCNEKTGKICELHKELIKSKKPNTYVLVTNIEVNPLFREKFIKQCKAENPNIENYQIIGLDELVSWIEMLPELRHLYFPTIFGLPRFDLRINLHYAYPIYQGSLFKEEMLSVSILNVGIAPSYLGGSPIELVCIVDGATKPFTLFYFNNPVLTAINPTPGEAIEPGKKQTYYFQTDFSELKKMGKNIFPVEIKITDEIGNIYTLQLNEGTRNSLVEYIYGNKK